MATTKVSLMPRREEIQVDDLLPLVADGTNFAVEASALATFVGPYVPVAADLVNAAKTATDAASAAGIAAKAAADSTAAISNDQLADAGDLSGNENVVLGGLKKTMSSTLANFSLTKAMVKLADGAKATGASVFTILRSKPWTPYQFNGKGDGSDDTDALLAWLASAQDRACIELPYGTWAYESPLASLVSGLRIRGDGARVTELVWAGTDTDVDMLTIGDGVQSTTAVELKGFRFESLTRMTGGNALRFARVQAGSRIYDVDFSGTTGNGYLWDGAHLDNVNVVDFIGSRIRVQNEAVKINGAAGSDEGSDVTLDNMAIVGCSIGTHVGGGIGGVYHRRVLFFGNGTSTLIDNALADNKNRELYYFAECIMDGCTDRGMRINDKKAGGSNITFNACIGSAGLYLPNPNGVNMQVQSWPNSRITIGPGQMFNATSHALQVDDATTMIDISDARQIVENGGWAVYASVPTNNIRGNPRFNHNNLGNWSPNTMRGPIAFAPAAGMAGSLQISKKDDRCAFNGSLTANNITIAQYAVIGNVPYGYRRGDTAPLMIVASGGDAGDVLVPGRLNANGDVEVLRPIAGVRSLSIVGDWDID